MKRLIIYASMAVFLALAILAACYGPQTLAPSDQAAPFLGAVFGLLAGVLAAVLALVADPLLVPPGSWRVARFHEKDLRLMYWGIAVLFWLYLAVLFLIFGSIISPLPQLKLWLQRAYLFFGTLAFGLSVPLPSLIIMLQMKRLANIVKARKEEAIAQGDEG